MHLRLAGRPRLPPRPAAPCRRLRVAAPAPEAAGGDYSSVALIRAAAPATLGVAAARAVRPGAGRPGVPLPRGGPSADQDRRAGGRVGGDLRARRVRLDVLDRRRPQPAQRGPDCGTRVRAYPGLEHPHRAGRLLRFRAGGGGTDDGTRRAVPRHRLADDWSRHDDRRRDPQVRGRHRPDRPEGRARGRRVRGAGRMQALRPGRVRTRQRSSSCSPMVPTRPASHRSTRRRSPPRAGCASTRSASAPRTRP